MCVSKQLFLQQQGRLTISKQPKHKSAITTCTAKGNTSGSTMEKRRNTQATHKKKDTQHMANRQKGRIKQHRTTTQARQEGKSSTHVHTQWNAAESDKNNKQRKKWQQKANEKEQASNTHAKHQGHTRQITRKRQGGCNETLMWIQH